MIIVNDHFNKEALGITLKECFGLICDKTSEGMTALRMIKKRISKEILQYKLVLIEIVDTEFPAIMSAEMIETKIRELFQISDSIVEENMIYSLSISQQHVCPLIVHLN